MAKFRRFDPSNKKKRKDRDYHERDQKIKPLKRTKPDTRTRLTYKWQEEVTTTR